MNDNAAELAGAPRPRRPRAFVETASFSHVAHDLASVVVTVGGLPAGAAAMAAAVTAVDGAGVRAEMLTVWPSGPGAVDMRFVARRDQRAAAVAALAGLARRTGCVARADDVARVTLHGEGMRTAPTVVARLERALLSAGVTTLAMSVANRTIAVVCPESQLHGAVRALREAFLTPM